MNQLQHEQYRKVNQSEYPCSDHPKISLMRTESCAEGRSQTAEHPLNEYLRGISITLNASFNDAPARFASDFRVQSPARSAKVF